MESKAIYTEVKFNFLFAHQLNSGEDIQSLCSIFSYWNSYLSSQQAKLVPNSGAVHQLICQYQQLCPKAAKFFPLKSQLQDQFPASKASLSPSSGSSKGPQDVEPRDGELLSSWNPLFRRKSCRSSSQLQRPLQLLWLSIDLRLKFMKDLPFKYLLQ